MNNQMSHRLLRLMLRSSHKPVTAEAMNRMHGNEVIEKRTRSGKIFDLGGGLHQAVLFADPVHYRDRQTGVLTEIDNSLVALPDAAGRTFFANRDNDELHVEFHHSGEGATVLLADAEQHVLAWFLENSEAVQPVHRVKVPQRHAKFDLRRDVLDQLEDEVIYPDILPGADLRCRVHALSFKDELIFHSKESVCPVSFIISAPGVTPVQKESGEVEFYTADSAIPFVLPVPFLKDAAPNHETGRVACSLEATERAELWRLTMIPDAAWIATAQFPVILDPAVETQRNTSFIQDNYVVSVNPNTHYSGQSSYLTVAHQSDSWGKCNAYLKFMDNALPAIDSSYYITKAVFNIRTVQTPTSPSSVFLREVLQDWHEDTITFNNRPQVYEKAHEYQYMAVGEHWYQFDISNLVRKWYAGTNNGFELSANSATWMQFYSSDHASCKPYLTINYNSLAGLENYLVYEDQNVGRAGVGHVSLYNGNLVFERQDTACSGSRMPVSVSHVYNSCYHGVDAFGVGAGWKLNVQQTLHKETILDNNTNTTFYVYMDEDGARHHFKLISGKWKDQSGKGMTLAISGSTATITDKGHNVWTFDLPTAEFNNNYANVKMLKSLKDACGNQMTVTTQGRIVKTVSDGIGRVTSFSTYNNLLSVINSPGYGESGACGFSYDNANR